MDSWTANTTTPANLKFENSPTESLLSTPGEMYPSLFGDSDHQTSSTMSPLDIMTPKSFVDDSDVAMLSRLSAVPETPGTPTSAAGEKKPTKKRKSWGQVLPEPKTNLPPRKRAKTEDEKEQRRVERVLRNRRAAQSSRERKRQEVEGLEKRNKLLEEELERVRQQNDALLNELRRVQGNPSAVASSSFDGLRPSPVTFSQELFSSQDGHKSPVHSQYLQRLFTPSNDTVNPASLSPSLSPVAGEDDYDSEDDEHDESAAPATPRADMPTTTTVKASPDATQHSAVMLCEDLQCRSAEAPPSAWLATSQNRLHPALSLLFPLQFLLAMSTSMVLSISQRPLMQTAMSLKANFSLPPTPAILNSILFLVTTPHSSASRRKTTALTTSTSKTSSQAISTPSRPAMSSTRSSKPTAAQSQTRPSLTLRLKSLRKILTCSPILARPLMDATMEALRLVSTEGPEVNRVAREDDDSAAPANGNAQRGQQRSGRAAFLNGAPLPSKEVLLTLLWVLKVEERRLQTRNQVNVSSRLGSPISKRKDGDRKEQSMPYMGTKRGRFQ
ncbi:hypothetical protein B0T17DRAFT_593493 [Bombardia bombarda]|uniref:BZIP domain-containing protein n=1 Tax=Bombardia bombarda TaxID=252184 RepID=A0AA39U525_9PEZI|nr:hypothetical protein B0T17DRAFT_593493 [Bombardia bombarda]